MTDSSDFDIVMIGHFARDVIVVDGVRTEACGGGVYYGSLALRQLGLRVGVATRVHPDDLRLLDELDRAGVAVHADAAPATSGIENTYDSADMERRTCRPLGFAGPFRLDDLPNWSARVYVATPIIAGEFDLAFVEGLARRSPVALDVQGFVRVRDGEQLIFKDWPEMARGLSLVTYLKVDQAEAELLTGDSDPVAAAKKLADYGPREIILTRSAGVTVWAEGEVTQAPFRPRSLAGRTGRGDTCFSTYLGMRLTCPPDRAAQVAAAITTLKQERPGPWRGTMADVEALLGS
ncbi:MAG: carbohydrate kinase [Phycisphaerae bacterium]|nr:carbohydrate kinase [Phycisphaerae bacterium]